MKRRCFILLFGGAFAFPLIGMAQQANNDYNSGTPRNGYGLFLPHLSMSQEAAFLHHAKEKAHDLFDYLSIAGNPDVDPDMRKQAGDRALEMFSQPDASATCEKGLPEGKNFSDMVTLVDWAVKQDKKPLTWEIQSSEIFAARPPKSHKIVSQAIWNSPAQKNEDKPIEIELNVEFRQIEKQFGTQSEQVWEVFFTSLHFRTPQ